MATVVFERWRIRFSSFSARYLASGFGIFAAQLYVGGLNPLSPEFPLATMTASRVPDFIDRSPLPFWFPAHHCFSPKIWGGLET